MESLGLIRDVLTKLQYGTQPFFMCLSFILLFDRFALNIGMLDHPDDRKLHTGAVPLVGGPAIYLAVSLSIIVYIPHSITALFLAVGALVLLLGLLDDRFDLPVRYRVVAQLVIAWLTVAYAGVEIHRIGNLVGFGIFELNGLLAIVFSMICIVGVINSFNMVDGVDGLAASIALTSFIGIGVLCYIGGFGVGARMSMIFVGALAAFLCFNARVLVPSARIFLGDSGSTLIGFSLAWLFISLTQSDNHFMSPVVAAWLFGFPLIDTAAVMVQRARRGISPMTGGRDHLHHQLLDGGVSTNRTVLLILTFHAILVAIGVLANPFNFLEPILFIGFIIVMLLYQVCGSGVVASLIKRFATMPAAVRAARPMPLADDTSDPTG